MQATGAAGITITILITDGEVRTIPTIIDGVKSVFRGGEEAMLRVVRFQAIPLIEEGVFMTGMDVREDVWFPETEIREHLSETDRHEDIQEEASWEEVLLILDRAVRERIHTEIRMRITG